MFPKPSTREESSKDACLRVIADHGDEGHPTDTSGALFEADEERVQEVVEMLSEQVSNDYNAFATDFSNN